VYFISVHLQNTVKSEHDFSFLYFRQKAEHFYLVFIKCSNQLLEANLCPTNKKFKYRLEALKMKRSHVPSCM